MYENIHCEPAVVPSGNRAIFHRTSLILTISCECCRKLSDQLLLIFLKHLDKSLFKEAPNVKEGQIYMIMGDTSVKILGASFDNIYFSYQTNFITSFALLEEFRILNSRQKIILRVLKSF